MQNVPLAQNGIIVVSNNQKRGGTLMFKTLRSQIIYLTVRAWLLVALTLGLITSLVFIFVTEGFSDGYFFAGIFIIPFVTWITHRAFREIKELKLEYNANITKPEDKG